MVNVASRFSQILHPFLRAEPLLYEELFRAAYRHFQISRLPMPLSRARPG
jgi:hypothetical protein